MAHSTSYVVSNCDKVNFIVVTTNSNTPGKRSGQAKFYSPRKRRVTPKGCLMIRRSLFPKQVLTHLDIAESFQ